MGRTWWTEPERDVDALIRVLDANQVDRAVLVQPVGAHGYDNGYLLDAAGRWASRLVAVPAVDLDDLAATDRDVAARIRELGGNPVVAGVRFFAVSPGSGWTADRSRTRAALRAAGRAGLVVVLAVFAHQLAHMVDDLADHDGPVVLDHCAFPDLVAGRLDADAPLLALRASGHVVLKVSSHLLREAAAGGDPGDLVGQLADRFGADRVMWGSDYPQSGADYPALLAASEQAVAGLSATERNLFFSANAARVFDRRGLW